MQVSLPILAGALMILLGAPHARAQTPQDFEALRKQIESIAAGQQAIERQLQEIRALIQTQGKTAAAPMVLMTVDGAPAQGSPGAGITLIEFSDYECPFCQRHTRETWPSIEKEYVQTGKVRYVFRNFPIPSLHKQAVKAHQAALCAGDQGKYWEMHGLLFAGAPALAQPALLDYGSRAGVDMDRFRSCLGGSAHLARIQQDIEEAQRAGMNGTPTFFIGLTPAKGEPMRVIHVLKGAQPYAAFKQAIDGIAAAAAQLPAANQ